MPYLIGGLRFKTHTGHGPFNGLTDCSRRCVGENITGTGLPQQQPDGSGFFSLQPSLTWLLPTDPAICFGTFSSLHNCRRINVSRLVIDGARSTWRTGARPRVRLQSRHGWAWRSTKKRLLDDYSSIAHVRQNDTPVAGSVRTQLGTLLIAGRVTACKAFDTAIEWFNHSVSSLLTQVLTVDS
jgi:hypothetical protein